MIWSDVVAANELPPGTQKVVWLGNDPVLVVNHEGQYFAFADLCTHDGGELSDGIIEGDTIVCCRHGARFSMRTGEVLEPPAYEPLIVYQVRIHQGRIEIGR